MHAETPVPDFRKIAENVLKDLPATAAETARAFFVQSFIKQGFTDTSFIPWVQRKEALPHKILNQSLALKSSIKITRADLERIEVSAGEGLSYAGIHNEGGTITIKVTPKMRKYFWMMFKKTEENKWKFMALTKKETLTIKIPKRQFIGNSETLNNTIEQMFIRRIQDYLKNHI